MRVGTHWVFLGPICHRIHSGSVIHARRLDPNVATADDVDRQLKCLSCKGSALERCGASSSLLRSIREANH